MTTYSSQNDASVNRRIVDDLASPLPQVKLLYVTPERLETQAFFEVVRGLHTRGLLSLLAIDEAHCISTWGQSSRHGISSLLPYLLKSSNSHVNRQRLPPQLPNLGPLP